MVATGGTKAGSGGTGSGGASGSGGTSGTGGVTGSGGASSGGAGGSGGSTSSGGAGSGGASGGGGTTTTTGTGGQGINGRGGAGGSGAGGTMGTGGAGAGGTGGSTHGTGGYFGGWGGATSTGGAPGTGGSTSGTGGSTVCAGRVISLGANGTGTASDSANAHVEVDMKTDLPIGNAKRTVEFWAFIKTTDWVGENNQVFYYGGTAATGSFGLDFGTGYVTGSTTNHATLNPFTGSAIRDDSGKDLGINSSTDQWVHIAMTWDGSVLTTYVNGQPKITAQGSGTSTTLATTQSILMIGCNPTNNNCFNGYFDEFRVWNVARTAAEISANYNKPVVGSEAGLVGYWKFDETSGTSTADAVTVTGHTAHAGTLVADTAAHDPSFVTPAVPVPLVCP